MPPNKKFGKRRPKEEREKRTTSISNTREYEVAYSQIATRMVGMGTAVRAVVPLQVAVGCPLCPYSSSFVPGTGHTPIQQCVVVEASAPIQRQYCGGELMGSESQLWRWTGCKLVMRLEFVALSHSIVRITIPCERHAADRPDLITSK